MSKSEINVPNESVVAVYDTMPKADEGVRALHTEGFSSEHISIVTRHVPEGATSEELSLGDDSAKEAAIGGALGGLAGLAGAATLLSITGVGLIVLTGPIVTLTGAIVGAFLGAMRGWGIHEKQIEQYEKFVSEGKVLVVVAGEPLEVEKAERVLRGTKPEHLHLHARSSTDSKEIDDRPKG
ncbi:MAG: general stress protein [Planctomycetota bacterium]|nr:MAG: general stress protein [Planctomycetota bacterium]